jgi:hypothetical protein
MRFILFYFIFAPEPYFYLSHQAEEQNFEKEALK